MPVELPAGVQVAAAVNAAVTSLTVAAGEPGIDTATAGVLELGGDNATTVEIGKGNVVVDASGNVAGRSFTASSSSPYTATAATGGADYAGAVRFGGGPFFDPTHPTFGATTASSNNNAAIKAAIAAANAAGGGTVMFPDGTLTVVSSARTDTVTYAGGGSLTITDASCVAGDVGSYCIGVGINGMEPLILTVNPGVSFTVDVAPVGVPTSLTLVKPAIVLLPRVQIVGQGGSGGGTVSWTSGTPSSQILDTGNGITVFIRGSGVGSYVFPYVLQDIVIAGQNTNTYGLYAGNFSAFLTCDRVHFGHHGIAGVALEANVNSNNFTDCRFFSNGTVGAAVPTAGVLMHPFWDQASAACNFYNCFWTDNYGFGICNGVGVLLGAFAVNLYGCQFNFTRVSAYANSGVSAVLRTDSFGNACIFGGWSESAATRDLWLVGPTLIMGFRCNSTITNAVHLVGGGGGPSSFVSCYFANHTATFDFGSNGNAAWMGCKNADTGTGITGVALLQMSGIGTTLSGIEALAGPFIGNMTTDTFSGAVTITVDTTKGNLHKIVATSNTASTLTPSSAGVAGQHLWILITADVTGGNVITFASTFKPNGTLTTSASKGHMVHFVSDGVNWWEVARTLAL